MEAWLKTDGMSFRFPVVPQNVEVTGAFNINTEYLANGNEIAIYGGKSLNRTSLTSHFPADKDRTYLDFYDFPDPLECVRIVNEIAKSQSEIRYIVTETEINWPIKITNFKRGPVDGSNDIEFTLDIIEYDPPKVVSWSPPQAKDGDKNSSKKIPEESGLKAETLKSFDRFKNTTKVSNKVKYHVVKHGDCLWDIAFKYYKNGSLYHKIKNNAENQKNYPKLKHSNVIYSGWKLVIP